MPIVVIEGIDGSGKRTQSEFLYNYLKDRGYKTKLISFPRYEEPTSYLVKKYLKNEIELNEKQASIAYAIDRLDAFNSKDENGKTMKDYLKEGYYIICDRYVTSNILHQCTKLEDEDEIIESINWIENLEYKILEIPVPDIVLFLKVDPNTSIQNLTDRYKGNLSMFDIHENVDNLINISKKIDIILNYCNWVSIECDNELGMISKEEIHEKVKKELGGIL